MEVSLWEEPEAVAVAAEEVVLVEAEVEVSAVAVPAQVSVVEEAVPVTDVQVQVLAVLQIARIHLPADQELPLVVMAHFGVFQQELQVRLL